ncbi:hypothetical protein ElyMa_005844200 [Elysia marginata]|uniref:Uncharacterized protein n=1 Tax=Elysia marginata TaxID=1093978 RepID=A0AAV4FXN1_9GAST|nr:hypothetical protein ElyMa_005844200 [Elysia marginata]
MANKFVTLAGAGILGLGCLFHIVGVSTNEWSTGDGASLGLWKVCSPTRCITIEEDSKPVIAIIICVAIYAAKIHKLIDEEQFGYSFGLTIAGGCLIFIGGIIAALSNLTSSGYYQL